MALTNAERQQRYRERHKGNAGLSALQIAERDAVMTTSLLPIRPKDVGPTFLGLGPSGWRAAPRELADHFGMLNAWERWQAEWQGHLEHIRTSGARARDILLNITSRKAKKIMRERGALGLCAAYDADPTFGAKRTGKAISNP